MNKFFNRGVGCIFFAGMLAIAASTMAQDIVVVDASASPEHQVSDHVVGLHFVYSYDRDAAYSNGDFAAWARKNNI